MKKFIAYFDYLGFKQFIENNDTHIHIDVFNNIYRDIEDSLGKGKLKEAHYGMIADLVDSNINCINFSDTVVFWTNDNEEKSLREILDVAFRFNWMEIVHFFPVRGSIVYGDIIGVDFRQQNPAGGIYNANSVFGKGLIKAYEKAESQNWAGTVLDVSVTEEIELRGYNLEEFLEPVAKRYKVPYKNGKKMPDEFVLKLVTSKINHESFANYGRNIKENFARYNKGVENKNVQEKLKNTIEFLASFK